MSNQFGLTKIGLTPQPEHRILFLSAGTSTAPSMPKASPAFITR
jgi:hypothetical protein